MEKKKGEILAEEGERERERKNGRFIEESWPRQLSCTIQNGELIRPIPRLLRVKKNAISGFTLSHFLVCKPNTEGAQDRLKGGEQKIKIKKVLFLLRYNETTTTWERENRRLERDSRGVYTHTHIHTRVRRGVCKTSRPRFVGWNGSIVDDGRLCCYVSCRCFTNSQTL